VRTKLITRYEVSNGVHGEAASLAWAGLSLSQESGGAISERLAAERKQSRSMTVSEKAETADADETSRQDVQEEAADEFLGRQGH
jgi:hypothetical protein